MSGSRRRTRRFVAGDELRRRRGGDELADRGQGQVVQRLEADAALAHVEPFAGPRECILERLGAGRRLVGAGEVERIVMLLRREPRVAERLAVVGIGIAREGQDIGDHAVPHRLLVALRQVLAHQIPHRLHDRPPFGGE